ncbi:hypothetical protein RI844_03130 [Thalassotalea fonticola]|uniref:Uncharacterized protein n=1 Tax=Thalassotalea fonticola TaxID=3065649 RepID=A0ABZ0GRA7_9GAMM|nr:hypothetical protein RI844_03130 [Colwelliaceae bacterium S1-1]
MTTVEVKRKCEDNYTPLNDFPLSQEYCAEKKANNSITTHKQGKFAVITIVTLTLMIVILA